MAVAAVPDPSGVLTLKLGGLEDQMRQVHRVRDRIDERIAEATATRLRLVTRRQRKTELIRQLRDRRVAMRAQLRTALEEG